MALKHSLAYLANILGYEIRRKPRFSEMSSNSDPIADQKRLLEMTASEVDVIFDVGANVGQSALKYRDHFPKSRVYSFEPVQSCYEKIVALSKKDPNIIPRQVVIDSEPNLVEFHEMSGSQTSSLLLPSEQISSFYPEGYFQVKNVVELSADTIDSVCEQEQISHISILKMDTQGTEDRVLRGASQMLQNQAIDLIFSEVSFTSIYANNVLFFQLCDFLHNYGYNFYSLYEFVRGAGGVLVGSDAIFLKRDLYRSLLNQSMLDQ